MNERQLQKACKKEAMDALKRQDKEQQNQYIEQEIRRNKARISSQIDDMEQQRNTLVDEAVALRKTDPESASYVIAMGNEIDKAIKQARAALAMANGQALQGKIENLIDASVALMRTINTSEVQFTPRKYRKDLAKQKRIHDMMVKISRQARDEELGIYLNSVVPSDGKGSAFEADVLAAERKAQIDEFDD